MCGIAGYFGGGDKLSIDPRLLSALKLINYRGPDESIILRLNNFCGGVVRLAIEAVNYGRQPVTNGRFVIGFNGEIFNYKDLIIKYELQSSAIKSEIEFLLEAWIKKGSTIFEDFEGQFAIFIYDDFNKSLTLVRDPYGIRPLFFSKIKNEIAFCSEAKGVFKILNHAFGIDEKAIAQISMFWTTVGSKTIFSDIHQVPPGHYVVLKDGEIDYKRYWIDPLYIGESNLISTETHAVDFLRNSLEESILKQTHGSVGYASYLSGGIDSSALAYYLSKNKNGIKLDTFSIGFKNSEYDETDAQNKISKFLGTNHHSLMIGDHEIAENFQNVINHAETLLFRTAPVPLYLLSKRVHEAGHKVVFTGEGADEILLGYDIFFESRIRRFWARQPQSQARPELLKRLYAYLPQFKESRYFSILKDFYSKSLSSTDDIFYSHLIRWSQYKQVSSYFNLSPSISEDSILEDLIRCLPNQFNSLSYDRKTQIIEFETLLSGYLLSSQGDRMSMAHSVEGRYPFLSQQFVKSMGALRSFQKARSLTSKSLFRKSMEGLLINDSSNRPKVAYQAPEAKSFLSSEHVSNAALLLRDSLDDLPILNGANIRMLEKKIQHPHSSARLGFRENMAYVMSCSYAHLQKLSLEWSK